MYVRSLSLLTHSRLRVFRPFSFMFHVEIIRIVFSHGNDSNGVDFNVVKSVVNEGQLY